MWKFDGRKKAEEFVIYPQSRTETDEIMIQSDKSIALINVKTGEGWLNAKGSNSKYGHHLSPSLGAVKHKFSRELISMVKDNQPKSGDYIGQGIYIN